MEELFEVEMAVRFRAGVVTFDDSCAVAAVARARIAAKVALISAL